MLHDITKDQFAFATGVASINEQVDVFALDQAQQDLQAALAFLDGAEREMWRDHRQVSESPFPALYFNSFWCTDFQQMTDRRGNDVFLAFEVIFVLGEPSERFLNIVRNGWFLGNYECFSHD